MSKIFGVIQTTEDLNELANNLRKSKEFDEIRLLCSENSISPETAEDFIKGDQLLLAASGHQEKLKALQIPTWDAVYAVFEKQSTVEDKATAERIRTGLLLPMESEPEQDMVPMGTCSLKDIASGIPKPTDEEIKAAEEEQNKPPVVHTVEDVKKKLEAELEIYRDGDSKYVIEKLVELCQKDNMLLEAIMLPRKSYDKAFQYFYQKSRTVGYKMPHGNLVYLDNDTAVKLSVEYFKKDDSAEKKSIEKAADKLQKKVEKVQLPKPKAEDKLPAAAAEHNPDTEPVLQKGQDMKVQKPKAKEIEGQISLFDL